LSTSIATIKLLTNCWWVQLYQTKCRNTRRAEGLFFIQESFRTCRKGTDCI